MTRRSKSLLFNLIAMILIACTLFFAVQNVVLSNIAYAASSYPFDNTDVFEDLQSSKVDGQSFDLRKYSFDKNGRISIINFVEYCYSYWIEDRSNYALYVYFYNPLGIDIHTKSEQNKIEIAVKYDKDGNAIEYEKFNLIFCSKSTGDHENLFYKFRIADTPINGKTFADRVDPAARTYDVSGVELRTMGDRNATEYGIGGSYTFTGYVEGYGQNKSEPSTLSCVVKDLETLSLSVHHTNYRTGISDKGTTHYNNVDTVYFSVPDRIFQTYGNLQKIHAEWWEYLLRPVVVSSEAYYIDLINQYKYKCTKSWDPTRADSFFHDGNIYDNSIPVGVFTGLLDYIFNFYPLQFANESFINQFINGGQIIGYTPLSFYSEDTEDEESVFSFLFNSFNAGKVESSDLLDAIYEFSQNVTTEGYIDCNGRQLSSAIFEDYVDDGRTRGYNNVNIDFNDTFDLKSYASNHNWFEKVWQKIWGNTNIDEDYRNVPPIYEVQASDLTGNKNSISKKLLVNKDDVSDLQLFYAQETLKGNHVILFRFANTDYYCSPAIIATDGNGYAGNTYVARETVFFDFDIIDLTFNKEGVYHVIPAVSSPIDIVNDITPPPATLSWWKVFLFCLEVIGGIIALVLVIWIIVKIISIFKPTRAKVTVKAPSSKAPRRRKKPKPKKKRKK